MFTRWLVHLLTTAALVLGLSAAALAPAASAAPAHLGLSAAAPSFGAVTHNCGIATCSVYVSRSGTKSMDRFLDGKVAQYGSWAGEAAVCGALGFTPFIGLGLATYCGFRFKQMDVVLDEAASKNKCFKVTYARTGAVTHISTNNGTFCKN